jgi:hypothetical protein
MCERKTVRRTNGVKDDGVVPHGKTQQAINEHSTEERLNNFLVSRSSVPSYKIAFLFGKAQGLQENASFFTIQLAFFS